jgi:Ca-activated chloride channel family protein
MGAGHTVTALYEVVPVGASTPRGQAPGVDPLRYQAPPTLSREAASGELMTVAVRYQPPSGSQSTKLSHVVPDDAVPFASATADHRFAAAVAHFGLVLRESPTLAGQTLADSKKLAEVALTGDVPLDRRELAQMIDRASELGSRAVATP